MEDQGIMALPQGQAMQGPGPMAQPRPENSPEVQDAFEQARMQVDPVEFGDELLSQGEIADPETVSEFRRMLDEMSLPAEVIDALGQMVDTVLAEPEKYAEIRKRFLDEGVPAELLPEQFDAAFFGALNMALDQLNSDLSPTPQAFARGGEAKLTPVASGIAQLGRKGDSQLAHITMSEARMLRRAGGSGTINPQTGLREYFLKKVFKSVGNAFKKIGSAVSKAVKGVVNGVKKFANSTVGRILTTVALGFFLGPAAAGLLGVTSAAGVAAVSGFVGGFGSSVLAGKSLRESLKAGAIGGLTAGAASGITGGMAAFQGAPAGTPVPSFTESVSQQWDKFTKGVGSLMGGAPAEAAPPSDLVTKAQETALPKPIEAPAPREFLASSQPGTDVASMTGRTATDVTAGTTGQLGPIAPEMSLSDVNRLGMNQGLKMPTAESLGQGLRVPGAEFGTGLRAAPGQVLSPPSFTAITKTAPMGITEGLTSAAKNVMAGEFGQAASNLGDVFFGTTPRMVGTGILGLTAAGGLKTEQPGRPGIIPTETGEDLLKKYPERYAVTPGGGQIIYGPYPGTRFAKGGIASLEEKYPRKTGPINGPGTGTSDSIPAMLSDGEFVFTAKAVRAMGNGSRRKGAKRMYALMKKLEGAK
jgi:hypothetical protein